MERRALGRTGIEIFPLSVGCGVVGGLMVRGERADQARGVARALEAGVNYFDTAPVYGDGLSEENLGRCLRELGVRDRVVIGTKVRLGVEDLEAPGAAVRSSLEASLARLGTDRVELLHLHNPIEAEGAEPTVRAGEALGEVAEALRRAVDGGLARHAGFTALGATPALKELAAHPSYETAQAYLNVLNPSGLRPGAAGGQQDFEGLIGDAADHGTGVIAIRVYAAGALSARPERHPLGHLPSRPLIPGSDYGDDVERARRLADTARALEMEGVLELGLRFALGAPGVATALVGLSSLDDLEAAIRWSERGPLALDRVERLVEMAAG
jgi:aryl-alcohol dehydrogenase-like predicted oxidoreductase